MTRINPLRLGRMATVLAGMILLFVCMMSNVAHAQTPPPCNSFWVDTDIPVTVNLTWAPTLPPTTPASVFAPPGPNLYPTAPGPGTITSFTVTLPCGLTIGPFSGPWGLMPGMVAVCVPDPCNPGRCIYIDRFMVGPGGTCPYEIHVFANNPNLCPGGCK
ncbi:MAG: hypothetical protein JWQ98_2359 [Chlorobi bacterium]|nr:hypothetical protein [Chlorobiota bacterium]